MFRIVSNIYLLYSYMLNLWSDFRPLFPIFSNNPDIIYVDNASTTQKPQSVIDAMNHYMFNDYANIHRWQYYLAEQSDFIYKESKKKVAELIWWDHREIIYTYNATYSCNILAQSLVVSRKLWVGDTVLVGIRDHHATIVPRQLLAKQFGFEVKFISIDIENLDIDRKNLDELLLNNVKVVMCSHVSNVTGIVYDMDRIHSLLSDDTFFAIDGSQAVPHTKIDVKNLWCDAYIFTSHKMMGPTGLGVLWIQKDLARSLDTLIGGGGIIDVVTTTWCSLVRTSEKFEPGTPNIIGAVGLGAACDFYKQHNIYKRLTQYESNLTNYLKSLLFNNKKVNIIWQHSHLSHGGILALAVDDPLAIAEQLANQHICIRAGGHCAHPLLHHLGYDKGLVRISVFVYNTREEMDNIAKQLEIFC